MTNRPELFFFVRMEDRASTEDRRARLDGELPRTLRRIEASANMYLPSEDLLDAINSAIALEKPLLLTGEPGVGKTQAASFIAHYFGLDEPFKMDVRSTSTAQDLLYTFDAVRYYRDAQLAKAEIPEVRFDRSEYIVPGPLWEAIRAEPTGVLLIDEIDKAPRDFPNDLLTALDQFTFGVPELKGAALDEDCLPERLQGVTFASARQQWQVQRRDGRAPIVVITSNAEQRLPEPFLRRCIFHEIEFDEAHLRRVIGQRHSDLGALDSPMVTEGLRQAMALRAPKLDLKKKPSTAEIIEWLYLVRRDEAAQARLSGPISGLPYLEVLLKTREDLKRVAPKRKGGA